MAAPPKQGRLRAIHEDQGMVVAVVLQAVNCFPFNAYLRVEGGWETLPEVDVGTANRHGCAIPTTTALIDGRLIAWDTAAQETRTMSYDFATGDWSEVDVLPLNGCESFPPPLTTDEWVLVFDYCDHDAARFNPVTNMWDLVRPPGSSGPSIWTGNEVLTWGPNCCSGLGPTNQVDAWRWPLPDKAAPFLRRFWWLCHHANLRFVWL